MIGGLLGDHLGTTRYARHRTSRRWQPVVPGKLNASDQLKRSRGRKVGRSGALASLGGWSKNAAMRA